MIYQKKIFFSINLLNFFFFSNCYANTEDLRREAEDFYKQSNYVGAQKVWKKILREQDKTVVDMRKAASIYNYNGKYRKSLNIYKEIIDKKEHSFSDLKNFLFSFDKLEDSEKNLYRGQVEEIISIAYEKINLNLYSSEYDNLVAKKSLDWATSEQKTTK